MEKYIFDKNSDGFENHINRDHNVWNYVYFMYNLKKKAETEYTGFESYIQDKIDTEDITWIPIGKALSIKDHENEKNKIEEKIKLINKELIKINEKIINYNKEEIL